MEYHGGTGICTGDTGECMEAQHVHGEHRGTEVTCAEESLMEVLAFMHGTGIIVVPQGVLITCQQRVIERDWSCMLIWWLLRKVPGDKGEGGGFLQACCVVS